MSRRTLQAEPAFPFSFLFDVFSVGRFRSKILSLPGFGYFSVEHAQRFHDNAKLFQPINLTLDQLYRNVRSKDLWNGTLVRYMCSKDLQNRALLANWKLHQKRINLSNRSKSTGSLESSPSFWTRHFKRSVKPRQSWFTQTTD